MCYIQIFLEKYFLRRGSINTSSPIFLNCLFCIALFNLCASPESDKVAMTVNEYKIIINTWFYNFKIYNIYSKQFQIKLINREFQNGYSDTYSGDNNNNMHNGK